MSLVAFILVGVVTAVLLRRAVPRMQHTRASTGVLVGIVGGVVGGMLASALVREGSFFQVQPVGLTFSFVSASVAVLWLDGLSPSGT